MSPAEGLPSAERLAEKVRTHLGLESSARVTLTEMGRLSNINHVYRVELPEGSLYLKVAPETPKRFPVPLPQARIFSEAEALRRFRPLASPWVEVPEVLFIDEEDFALGMSDVGQGRGVLFDLLFDEYGLLVEQAHSLGTALGRVHDETRGMDALRPPAEHRMVSAVIYDGLLAPGIQAICPGGWDEVKAQIDDHATSLVHCDLWSKNLLVRRGSPMAVVDFEGAILSDPAVDLGTVLAVALLPALERPDLGEAAEDFIRGLLSAYVAAVEDGGWAERACLRSLRYCGVFLAARGFGPFAYELAEATRHALRFQAASLVQQPPREVDDFLGRLLSETPSVGSEAPGRSR